MYMKYKNLENLMFANKISKKTMGEHLGITSKAVANKISGKSDFYWNEVLIIQNDFFPELSKNEIFKSE